MLPQPSEIWKFSNKLGSGWHILILEVLDMDDKQITYRALCLEDGIIDGWTVNRKYIGDNPSLNKWERLV